MHAGTLPASWGSPGAFPALASLVLDELPLTGSLPPSWGSNTSLPALTTLTLGTSRPDFSCLSGPLPTAWGSPDALQQLQKMKIQGCLEGELLW